MRWRVIRMEFDPERKIKRILREIITNIIKCSVRICIFKRNKKQKLYYTARNIGKRVRNISSR